MSKIKGLFSACGGAETGRAVRFMLEMADA
jgi:hypothetical protein